MNDIGRAVGGFLNDHPGWAAIWYYALGFLGRSAFAYLMLMWFEVQP